MYTTKQRILNELSNSDILTNDNNITLRYFQLYLEGNYNNEQEYYDNLEYIKLHKDNYKKMLTFVINKFCNFMKADFNCSYSYVQKIITSIFNKKELEQLNNKLIDISIYMYNDK
tara:strand:- start:1420 stop:1764 length:345 start_codon:yes stop_codon:yes gene_type:complete